MNTAPNPPPIETEAPIADHLVRRGLVVAPVVVLVAAALRGSDGAASAAFALALVLGNFLLAARSLAWSARISPGLYMGVAFGGYFVRLALITAAVLAVRGVTWIDLPTVGVTLVVAHLGLLVWELRAISLTFAAPGLKPQYEKTPGAEGAASNGAWSKGAVG